MNNDENKNMNHDVNDNANNMNNSVKVANSNTNSSGLPMRWYKFLIHFGLYASAVLNFFSSFVYFSGLHYGQYSEMIYEIYSKVQACDMLMGATMVVMALIALSARFALVQYKKKAPTLLLALYMIQAATLLLYPFMMTTITGINVFDSTMAIQFISAIVVLGGNYFYFEKRKRLFTNN